MIFYTLRHIRKRVQEKGYDISRPTLILYDALGKFKTKNTLIFHDDDNKEPMRIYSEADIERISDDLISQGLRKLLSEEEKEARKEAREEKERIRQEKKEAKEKEL